MNENDKKIKIKDLAVELKMDKQDVVNAAREEGFTVRNAQTVLTNEEANRLRKRFGKTEEQHKEVIVRRRKPHQDKAEGQAHDKSEASAQAAEDTVSAEPRAEQGDKADHAERGDRSRNRSSRNRSRTPRSEVAPAKVISRPSDAKPQQTEPAEDKTPAEQPAAAAQVVSRPAEAADQARPAAKSGEGEARGQQERKRQQRTVTPEVPKVRIISRPAPSSSSSSAPRGQQRTDRDGDRPRSGSGRDGSGDRQRTMGARDGGHMDGDARRRSDGARTRSGSRTSGPRLQNEGRSESMEFDPSQNADSRNGQSKKKRNKGRRTVDFQQMGFDNHMDDNDAPRMRSNKSRKKKPAQAPTPVTQPLKAAKRKVRVEGTIRVSDMAHQMGLKANELIKVLFNLGIMATINQSIDFDTAAVLAAEFNYEVEKTGFEEKDYLEITTPDKPEDLKPRPPVVTIMGHVDHGKTSLLDAIRKTHVTSDEAGGITQHIGAYHVHTQNGDVVFLDTPGHEAFTAMRARGAQITDLVILVVAADDGVMEQTREAINHARAADVPIIVAVNKIDKPSANPDRVLRELAELGLQAEEWGGDTIVVKVSAKTHQGLDELLELLALQSEVMELKANPNKPARGHIIEAKLDKGRGPVATVLIQEGTLHQGDNFVCGTFSGRVRALLNDQGKKVREAGPSIPVEVQGFAGVPDAGEEFAAVADEKVARRIADARAIRQREKELASESKITLETFLASSADEEQKTLNLVVKADVQGSLEAVQESLRKAGTDKVTVNVVHGGTGAISESDILLASASKAIIIGFNIRPTAKIKEVAAHENVDIRFYDIIYKLVDDVKSAMAGLLAPVEKEVYLGQAEVRQTFSLPKVGTIAGAYVADGKMLRNARVRLLRDGVVVWTGRISSLKRFKDDAKEVLRGNECGIGLENYNDIKNGDIIEAFDTVQEAATL